MTTTSLFRRPALIVIDVQKGFDNAEFWGNRNNPAAESNIGLLLNHWTERGWPVVLVRHDSTNPASPLAPGQEGHDFKDVVSVPGDLVVTKSVNSSFYGDPDLEAWLRGEGLEEVVVCGITTNHCCETTARMAGNLGFETYFVLDATHTFDRLGPHGDPFTADQLAAVTAANLHGEFATVLSTAEAVTR